MPDTYYVIPNDGAEFKCYECGNRGKASKEVFVKITGLWGARHRNCVEDIETMDQIDPPKEFDPRP